jgi:ABC-type Zn uptake system ZnuABC Zn-binding protein ZnuA
MKTNSNWISSFIAVLTLALLSARGPESVRVVATIPDLARLAEEIGGEHVEVRALSKGTENLHAVHVRPSMLIALSKADLLLEMGLSLEAAWLPELLLKSKNKRIAPGAPGFQNCSDGWEARDVPPELSRKEGDVHPQGNPHFNLDPLGGPHLAAKVHGALVRIDQAHKEQYDNNYAAWKKRLADKQERWQAIAAKLAGKRVAVYHTEYSYLAARLGMEVTVSIEPKPGIPPSPADVTRIVRTMQSEDVKVILTAAWSNNRLIADIARKTGADVLEIPNQVGGASWATDWIALMDGVHERLAQVFRVSLPR